MPKKRLLVLAVLLCLLVATAVSRSAKADVYVSCSMACDGCHVTFDVQNASVREIETAIATCCRQAKDATPLDCPR